MVTDTVLRNGNEAMVWPLITMCIMTQSSSECEFSKQVLLPSVVFYHLREQAGFGRQERYDWLVQTNGTRQVRTQL